jgi:hypothetical protein
MLPDFPAEKKRLSKYWLDYCRLRYEEYCGPLAHAQHFAAHEGGTWRLERVDGSTQESDYKDVSAHLSLLVDEVPDLTPDRIKEKMDALAKEMAQKVTRRFLDTLNAELEKMGRVVNAAGQPITPDLFLKMLDSIEMTFDERGDLIPPSILIPPAVWKANEAQFKTWGGDAEFRERHRQIIERKRMDWRDRESRRKLVD